MVRHNLTNDVEEMISHINRLKQTSLLILWDKGWLLQVG